MEGTAPSLDHHGPLSYHLPAWSALKCKLSCPTHIQGVSMQQLIVSAAYLIIIIIIIIMTK